MNVEFVLYGNNKPVLYRKIDALDTISRKWVVTVRPWRSKRSDLQNRAYWAFLREFGDYIGQTDEEMHETLKAMFLSELVTVMGKEIRRAKSTTKLKTNEFAEYFDHCLRVAAENGFVFDMRGYQ